jgi:hypothetical protein
MLAGWNRERRRSRTAVQAVCCSRALRRPRLWPSGERKRDVVRSGGALAPHVKGVRVATRNRGRPLVWRQPGPPVRRMVGVTTTCVFRPLFRSFVSARTVPRSLGHRSLSRDCALPRPESASVPASARTYTPCRRASRVMDRRLSLDLGHDCAARAPARGLIRRLFCGDFCSLRVSASVHLSSRRPDGPGHHAIRPAAT